MSTKSQENSEIAFPGNNTVREFFPFPDTLRKYRLKAKLDQAQVGKACGVTCNCVSNWERGVSRPDLKIIPRLCDLLNIPLSELFGMQDYATIPDDEKSLLDQYRGMTSPNKKQLHSIADAILESQRDSRREDFRNRFCHLIGHDTGLAAGFGIPITGELESHPIFVRVSRDAMRSDDIFPINGASMEPTYPNGAHVFIKRVDTDTLAFGDHVACMVSGTPFIKIYQKDGLHSINPKYRTIHITDDEDVRLIGKVVALVPDGDLATKSETEELLKIFADEL